MARSNDSGFDINSLYELKDKDFVSWEDFGYLPTLEEAFGELSELPQETGGRKVKPGRMSEANRRKQRNYRFRQKHNLGIVEITADIHALANKLIEDRVLTTAEALVRANIQVAVAEMLAKYYNSDDDEGFK